MTLVNWVIIATDNGLLPVWGQSIIWNNADLLSVMQNFNLSLSKMYIKMLIAKCVLFCSGLNLKFSHELSLMFSLLWMWMSPHPAWLWGLVPHPEQKRQPTADRKWSCPSRLESWLDKTGEDIGLQKMNTVNHWTRPCMAYNIKTNV